MFKNDQGLCYGLKHSSIIIFLEKRIVNQDFLNDKLLKSFIPEKI